MTIWSARSHDAIRKSSSVYGIRRVLSLKTDRIHASLTGIPACGICLLREEGARVYLDTGLSGANGHSAILCRVRDFRYKSRCDRIRFQCTTHKAVVKPLIYTSLLKKVEARPVCHMANVSCWYLKMQQLIYVFKLTNFQPGLYLLEGRMGTPISVDVTLYRPSSFH